MINSQSIILSLLREDDENDTIIYNMLLNRPSWWGTCIVSIPKHWSYKDDNPSSTPLSQRSRSFSFRNLKPLIITWGRVVSQLTQVHNEWHQRGPYKNKERQWWFQIIKNERQSLSFKIKNPNKSKNLWRRLRNWGIPLTIIPKEETVQAKNRDNKNQTRKRSYKPSTKKKWLPIQNKLSTSESSLENQSKDSNKV